MVAKIADFGVSCFCDTEDHKIKKVEGTSHFMPPETLFSDNAKKGYSGEEADIWSMGVTFFCFFFKKVPFDGDSLEDLFEAIKTKE